MADRDATEHIEALEMKLVGIAHGEDEEAADYAAEALTGLVAARRAINAEDD